ncbi:sugar transporter [Agrobacterium sp.]|uniref:GumC family protein n=1 Tax=Agrobacterium sp. TaxID=361 RepID=UPI0028B1A185|nr:sugar transporter [Agrobacterium sp.]
MSSNQIFRTTSLYPLSQGRQEDGTSLGLADVAFFLKLRWRIITGSTIALMLLAFAYLLVADRIFVANTQLLIFPQIPTTETQRSVAEDAYVEAQLEIARSTDVMDATAKKLNLAADPAFADKAPGLMERLKGMLIGSGEPSAPTGNSDPETARAERVAARLQNMVLLRRVGRSTIIEVSASATDPIMAARIADTVAEEYISKNIEMKAQAARQYSAWLEKFVELQQKDLTEASNALAAFKGDPRDQFKLAELQSATDARRKLFENTLNQFAEAKHRISYPVSDVTIVSKATPPLSKDRPRSSLIMAFSMIAGLGAGCMAALFLHGTDRRIRRPHAFTNMAGLNFVAPLTKTAGLRRTRQLSKPGGAGHDQQQFIPGIADLSARVAGLRRKNKTLIGIVGVDRQVGTSTIACEMAILSAASGSRTLLVDAEYINSGLSKLMAPSDAIGLANVLDAPNLLQGAMLRILPDLKFLPIGTRTGTTPAVRLSSHRTELKLAELKSQFDTVFVDISPATNSPDASAIAPELDGIILVMTYGETATDSALRVIEDLRGVGVDVLGAVLNSSPAGTV